METIIEEAAMRLNVRAFSLACGLFWGAGLFMLTWWMLMFDGPSPGPTLLGRIYRGYEVTPIGSVIGLAWALGDGLMGGAVFAWLYNALAGSRAARSHA